MVLTAWLDLGFKIAAAARSCLLRDDEPAKRGLHGAVKLGRSQCQRLFLAGDHGRSHHAAPKLM